MLKNSQKQFVLYILDKDCYSSRRFCDTPFYFLIRQACASGACAAYLGTNKIARCQIQYSIGAGPWLNESLYPIVFSPSCRRLQQKTCSNGLIKTHPNIDSPSGDHPSTMFTVWNSWSKVRFLVWSWVNPVVISSVIGCKHCNSQTNSQGRTFFFYTCPPIMCVHTLDR